MKIKDLSSTNKVASAEIIKWKLQCKNGEMAMIKLFGYHIPAAKVCLLSLHVLIREVGGHAMITIKGIHIKLNNGIQVWGRFCQRSNLPLVPLQ
jgi:hypothetical protein